MLPSIDPVCSSSSSVLEDSVVVLNEASTGCELMCDTESALEPCPWPNQSIIPALIGMTGEEAPAELII